jgi:hypothetical protein
VPRVPLHPCPHCGAPNDGAGNPRDKQDRAPSPGDITICAYCHELSIFGEGLETRKLTESELVDVQRSPIWPHVERVRRALREVKFPDRRAKRA